jgi:DNA invertase Pin-like site-specific DNA recombinase
MTRPSTHSRQPRAVIYARYSSDLQSAASIADQAHACSARIRAEGWVQGATYSDEGLSGATALRPGYQSMLADARAGRFDIVVAEALDRLSRDQEDIAALYKALTFAGVKLVTLAEGEINELHVGLKGTMNALFLKDLAQKTRRGLEGRIRQGRSGGGKAYGYDVVRSFSEDGEPRRGARTVNEAEAAIVRRIFEAYAAGTSPRAIAHALNREGILGPSGKAWGPSTINGNRERGTGILNNELYIGRLVWNRLRYIKDPATGKRVSRLNPEQDWVIAQVPELRIIDQALWDRVKARQATLTTDAGANPHNKPAFWDRRRPRTLLSGLLKCGVCSGGYSKISAAHYGCSTARNKGTCTNKLNIRRDHIEPMILLALRTQLMDPDLFKLFVEEFHAEVNRLRKQDHAEQDRISRDLTRTGTRIANLVKALADGMTSPAITAELDRLEEEKADLLRKKEALGSDRKPLLHPNLAQIYRDRVADLEPLLAHDTLSTDAMDRLRALIDEVVLTPTRYHQLDITLKGDIVAMLYLAFYDSKKPGTVPRDGLEQVKLVAGAGFEPATFRL